MLRKFYKTIFLNFLGISSILYCCKNKEQANQNFVNISEANKNAGIDKYNSNLITDKKVKNQLIELEKEARNLNIENNNVKNQKYYLKIFVEKFHSLELKFSALRAETFSIEIDKNLKDKINKSYVEIIKKRKEIQKRINEFEENEIESISKEIEKFIHTNSTILNHLIISKDKSINLLNEIKTFFNNTETKCYGLIVKSEDINIDPILKGKLNELYNELITKRKSTEELVNEITEENQHIEIEKDHIKIKNDLDYLLTQTHFANFDFNTIKISLLEIEKGYALIKKQYSTLKLSSEEEEKINDIDNEIIKVKEKIEKIIKEKEHNQKEEKLINQLNDFKAKINKLEEDAKKLIVSKESYDKLEVEFNRIEAEEEKIIDQINDFIVKNKNIFKTKAGKNLANEIDNISFKNKVSKLFPEIKTELNKKKIALIK